MRRFLRDNGLSLVLFFLFFCTFIVGQSVAGFYESNEELREHGRPAESFGQYVLGSHFLEATMENFESEFLQMFVYVLVTAFLYQRGSSESKDPDKKGEEAVDRDPRRSKHKRDAPWPVRRGGFVLRLYENSLSLTFLLLFLVSFLLHAVGGAAEYNLDQQEHGRPGRVTVFGYIATSRFWFESFQNWQSEFLALAAMVWLSIWLRQRGSPESKPVDAPHSQTGSE